MTSSDTRANASSTLPIMSSIRVKLFGLTVIVLTLVVVSTTTYFAQRHIAGLRNALVAKAELYARMASRQSVAALAFDDVQTAREAFEAASVDPDVALITLRRADGSVLYEYASPGVDREAGATHLIRTRAPIIGADCTAPSVGPTPP